MKKRNITKIGLITFLSILISFQAVQSLGITGGKPSDLRMMGGDIADFSFQIQALSSTNDQSCTVSTEGFDPLIITFEDQTVIVGAGETETVYGTITIPSNAEIKAYEGRLWADCSPHIEVHDVTGSKINQKMGIVFSLDVVATEAERNVPERKAPEQGKPVAPYLPTYIILIIIAAVLVVGVYYWLKKDKKKK